LLVAYLSQLCPKNEQFPSMRPLQSSTRFSNDWSGGVGQFSILSCKNLGRLSIAWGHAGPIRGIGCCALLSVVLPKPSTDT
jgi:hypothetical protein